VEIKQGDKERGREQGKGGEERGGREYLVKYLATETKKEKKGKKNKLLDKEFVIQYRLICATNSTSLPSALEVWNMKEPGIKHNDWAIHLLHNIMEL